MSCTSCGVRMGGTHTETCRQHPRSKMLEQICDEEFTVSVELSHLPGLKVPMCTLCGNVGTIDTRGRAMSPDGKTDCGSVVCCICPNGRAEKATRSRRGAEASERRLPSFLSWPSGGAADRAPQWLRSDLVGILDQAGKNQWLNVAYRAFEVVERAWTEFLAVGGTQDKFDLLCERMAKLANRRWATRSRRDG